MNEITEDPGQRGADTTAPLPGEAGIPDVARPPRPPMPRKGLLAVALLVLSLVGVSAISIQRLTTTAKKPDEASKRASDRPAAATADPKRLDMRRAPAATPESAAAPSLRIPAIVPTGKKPPSRSACAAPAKAHRYQAAGRSRWSRRISLRFW